MKLSRPDLKDLSKCNTIQFTFLGKMIKLIIIFVISTCFIVLNDTLLSLRLQDFYSGLLSL